MVDGQAAMTNPNDEFGKLIDLFGFKSNAINFELNKESEALVSITHELCKSLKI